MIATDREDNMELLEQNVASHASFTNITAHGHSWGAALTGPLAEPCQLLLAAEASHIPTHPHASPSFWLPR